MHLYSFHPLKVDSVSGEVSIKANFDYEQHTSFTFKVLAVDNGSPSLTGTATVTVSISDVNDNNPYFTDTFLNKEVAYAGQCSSLVASPVCIDADSGVNADVTCSMDSTAYRYLFTVAGAACQYNRTFIKPFFPAPHLFTFSLFCTNIFTTQVYTTPPKYFINLTSGAYLGNH